MNKNFLSPLRYPGGKTRAVKQISQLIPDDTQKIISPFFGGGSIEIHCAKKNISVKGYDIFEPLVNFWQCLLKDSEKLSVIAREYNPLSKDYFYYLKKNQFSINDDFRRAAVFFVLNRSSFSGSTLSGGMSPDHPRFNENSINRLKSFKVSGVSVENLDFTVSIPKNSGELFYLDPPYLIKNNLYGEKGNAHKEFQHEKLYNLIKNQKKWIMSYNNCPEIKDIYKGFNFLYPEWKYGMSKDKNSKEIIILSDYVFGYLNTNKMLDKTKF